jgi:fumarate reductase flavoprotein subunit
MLLPTGSTALSSGFVPAAATQAQQAQGISDSPALFAQDIQAKAHGRASPVLVDAYSRAALASPWTRWHSTTVCRGRC